MSKLARQLILLVTLGGACALLPGTVPLLHAQQGAAAAGKKKATEEGKKKSAKKKPTKKKSAKRPTTKKSSKKPTKKIAKKPTKKPRKKAGPGDVRPGESATPAGAALQEVRPAGSSSLLQEVSASGGTRLIKVDGEAAGDGAAPVQSQGKAAAGSAAAADPAPGQAASARGASPPPPAPRRRPEVVWVDVPQDPLPAPGPAVSPAVYPPQRFRIRIDHASHVADMELSCLECHRSVLGSATAADRNLPNHLPCQDCHLSQDPAENDCTKCHGAAPAGAPVPELVPPARLHFGHRAHLARLLDEDEDEFPKVAPFQPLREFTYGDQFDSWKLPAAVKEFKVDNALCLRCHFNGSEAGLEQRVAMPAGHEPCFTCHDGEQAGRRCGLCHPQAPDAPLREGGAGWQELGLLPRSHDGSWLEGHRDEARLRQATCESCHARTDCVRCHEGREWPSFHPANWMLSHGLGSRTGHLQCQSCHRRQECRSCHLQRKVAVESFPGTWQAMFHPPGWMTPRNPRYHGVAGRRDLLSCVSCHREADCARGGCHR